MCNIVHWQAIHLLACHLAPSLYLSVYSPYTSENDSFVYICICFQLRCEPVSLAIVKLHLSEGISQALKTVLGLVLSNVPSQENTSMELD